MTLLRISGRLRDLLDYIQHKIEENNGAFYASSADISKETGICTATITRFKKVMKDHKHSPISIETFNSCLPTKYQMKGL